MVETLGQIRTIAEKGLQQTAMAAWKPSRLDEHLTTARQSLRAIVKACEELAEQDRKWSDVGMVRCPRCDGDCSEPGVNPRSPLADMPCTECGGEGAVPDDSIEQVCPQCDGTGSTSRVDDFGPHVVCAACGGSGSASHPRRRRSA